MRIEEEIVRECGERFPGIEWECEACNIGRYRFVYKLIGEAHGVRTFERVSPYGERDLVIADAVRCAEEMWSRIECVWRKVRDGRCGDGSA